MHFWTMPQIPLRWTAAIACASLCFFVSVVDAANRSIPEVVNIKVFAATQDDQLDLLVRMPLSAVKDIQIPVQGEAGYLDLVALQSMLGSASKYWVAESVVVTNRGNVLSPPNIVAARIAIISDLSFNAYKDAVAHFSSPSIAKDEQIFLQQAWLDVHLRYAIDKAAAVSTPALAVEPRVASLGVKVTTELTIVQPDGTQRLMEFEGDPGIVYLNPRFLDIVRQFFTDGIRAVVSCAELMVFVFCLVMPFRSYREVQPAAVTFMVPVMLGVMASAVGFVSHDLWFRSLIDIATVLAILLAAAANIANRVTARRRALFALVAGFAFGLLSAFRFDEAAQFASSSRALAGTAFTVGMATTIILSIALFIPLLRFLFSFARVETVERIILSALAADTAWNWLAERWPQFRRIPFGTEINASFMASIYGYLAIAVLLGGLLWIVNVWLKSHGFADDARTDGPAP